MIVRKNHDVIIEIKKSMISNKLTETIHSPSS